MIDAVFVLKNKDRSAHFVAALVYLSACSVSETTQTKAYSEWFDHPAGVVALETPTSAWVVVANTAFIPESLTFGTGFLTIIDGSLQKPVKKVPTSAPNPQFVVGIGTEILVVCSGQTRIDLESGEHTAEGAGALDRFTLDAVLGGQGPSVSIPLPVSTINPLFGGPGSIAVSADHTVAYIGSGLSPVVFKVDLSTNTVVRGTDNPILVRSQPGNDTMTVHWHPSGVLLVASFNTNLIFRLDPMTDTFIGDPIDVGLTDDLEGPIAMAVREGESPDVFVLLSVANAITAWDFAQRAVGVQAGVVSTGPVNNRIHSFGDSLWVVNSGSNNLQRIQMPGFVSTLPYVPFPVGSAPWDVAFLRNQGSRLGYITLNLHNAIAVVDMDNGETLEILQ